MVARASLVLQPSSADGLGMLATALREMGEVEEAALVAQEEVLAEMQAAAAAATPALRWRVEAALAATAAEREAKRSRDTKGSRDTRGRLVIFCRRSYSGQDASQPSSMAWGPHAKEHGIGGSESAVISISRELAAQGWVVEVYASPPDVDIGLDEYGVLWAPYWSYPYLGREARRGAGARLGGRMAAEEAEVGGAVDVFIAWRFPEGLAVGAGARQRFLWLHDEVRPELIPQASLEGLHGSHPDGSPRGGILVLSEFHRSQVPLTSPRHPLKPDTGS